MCMNETMKLKAIISKDPQDWGEFKLLRNKVNSKKEMLYAVQCLKSSEDMILALTGQFKQLSHEPKKFS